jgi:hypothetical protein
MNKINAEIEFSKDLRKKKIKFLEQKIWLLIACCSVTGRTSN